ncbi:MAG: aminotransferase class III-fold pyridoxal phosphate-dependent enzyme, partial [Actinomycetota bacterium]|nr:aminotransferase class III-fold pyridoxal phosphate-dependent enzyme [Actinomycetota bacterium]
GFRLDAGGAQAKFDIDADLTTYGKVIGGGLPVGALGGRADIMDSLSPLGPVFHSGTLSGNPLTTAAGLAVLDLLDDDLVMELSARARRVAALLRDACAAAGLPAQFPVAGTLVGTVCGRMEPVYDFDDARTTDTAAYARFFHAMLDAGVMMAPGAYEAMFVGLGHDDDVLDAVGLAAHSAAAVAAAGAPVGAGSEN